MSLVKRRAILIINLGTPLSPNAKDVKDFLRQFFMDKNVIDIPYPLRWLLVNGTILRKRPQSSAKNYEKIWTEEGSPLLVNTMKFYRALQTELGQQELFVAMTYGNPTIPDAIADIKRLGFEEILVLPLYPHYSDATHKGIIDQVNQAAKPHGFPKEDIIWKDAFFDDPGFQQALAKKTQSHLQDINWDHLLMSFHGLPEKQVAKAHKTCGNCLKLPSCRESFERQKKCYRSQCFVTADKLAEDLGIGSQQYSVGFQSRLGKAKWIEPYTDNVLEDLVKNQGVKNLAVVCPSFVADCLETLEEIGMGLRDRFVELGGENFTLVPCLNDDPQWAKSAAQLLLAH